MTFIFTVNGSVKGFYDAKAKMLYYVVGAESETMETDSIEDALQNMYILYSDFESMEKWLRGVDIKAKIR